MSKYSPTVGVEPLDLGGALREGLNSYLQAKQDRYEKDLTAAQTGVGITWPTPETPAPSAPVSIMGTAAPVPTAMQTSPSAPLPGVAGLPSPGRVQPMNLPTDFGAALQTGQQRMLNGVAQPHDDLRAAIAKTGAQVNDTTTPIMALSGQSYTPPTSPEGGGFDPNAMVTLPSGKQAALGTLPIGRQMQQMNIANYLKTVSAGKDAAEGNLAAARAGLVTKQGDIGWNAAKAGADAGAVAAAQWPSVEAKIKEEGEQRLAEIAKQGASAQQVEKLRGSIEAGIQTMRDNAASGRAATARDFQQNVVEPFQALLLGTKIGGTQANTKLGLSGKLFPQAEGLFLNRGPLADPTTPAASGTGAAPNIYNFDSVDQPQ